MAVAERVQQDEGTRQSGRSLVSTLPGDSVRSAALQLDQPAWCVDLGHTLVAMSTYEVWLAFAQENILPGTKVWREGMPWWEPIGQIPEFALAMPDAKIPLSLPPRSFGRSPAAASVPGAVAASAAGSEEQEEAVPSELLRKADAIPAPPRLPAIEAPAAAPVAAAPVIETSTPAPVVVEHETLRAPAPHKDRSLRRLDRRGIVSVALGAVVAILALAMATSGPGPAHAPQEVVQPVRVAAGAGAVGVQAMGSPESVLLPAIAPVPATSSSASAPERAPKHVRPWDRGQRRAR